MSRNLSQLKRFSVHKTFHKVTSFLHTQEANKRPQNSSQKVEKQSTINKK